MAALVTSGVVHCAVAQAGAEEVAEVEERASAAPAEIPASTAAIAAEVAGFMVVLEGAGDALVIEEMARAMAINAA